MMTNEEFLDEFWKPLCHRYYTPAVTLSWRDFVDREFSVAPKKYLLYIADINDTYLSRWKQHPLVQAAVIEHALLQEEV